MIFKDLKKKLKALESPNRPNLEIFNNKAFWIWNKDEHRLKDIETKGIMFKSYGRSSNQR